MTARRQPAAIALIRGSLASLLLALNTICLCLPLFVMALVKFLLPMAPVQRVLRAIMHVIADAWVSINGLWMAGIDWQITDQTTGLDRSRSWLVTSNHQSWVDIFALQNRFNRRIPMLKFFLKQELIWVPIIGLAWWALEFPFMKRHSRAYLEKHPEKRGQDMETTRKACERYRTNPVSVFNFAEGTRFTPEKHDRQKSPFQYLLKPKAGGMAFVIDAMGDQLAGMIDVTLYYPDGRPTFWDLASGRISRIVMHIERVDIPTEFIGRNYEQDQEYRVGFQRWMNARWEAKDALLAQMRADQPPTR